MQNSWTNPFAEKRREINLHSCVGDFSDDDDSCSDQVVYHEDHLENLFGLYNCAEEAKYGGPSQQQELLKTGVECYKDHLLLAVPSNRETAVWDALEDSELTLQEAFQVPENDREQLWSSSTLKDIEKEQVFGDCLDDKPTEDLEDEDTAVANCQSSQAGYVEASDDVNIDKISSKDGWDHVAQGNADFDDIQGHVARLPSSRPKSYCLVKQAKGRYKKKLNFSFRSMHNVPSVRGCAELKNDCHKLSLAQKLQSLAEANCPSASKMNMQTLANNSAPCTEVPICEKLLELFQNDSSIVSEKKARKSFNTKVKKSSFKQCVMMDKVAAGDVTSSHALDREDHSAESGISKSGVPSESINDQFRKALLEAPPAITEDFNRQGKLQGFAFGFAARLQKVLEREKNDRAYFLKTLQTRDDCQGWLDFMDVKILTKSLEARLSSCLCEILKCSEAYGAQATSNAKVMVIFNMQTIAQLELEAGSIVRLYPPWQEVLLEGEITKTILCTYCCEVMTNHDAK